jgi:hypothetical protein
MHHRYGRHGPRAWLRWRERRFNHHPPYFDNRAYVLIVCVPLPPVNIERIIIVMTLEDQKYNPVVDSSTDGNIPYLPSGDRQDPFRSLIWKAQEDGGRKAIDDCGNETSFSERELREFARELGHKYVTDHFTSETANGRKFSDIVGIYIDEFINAYRENLGMANIEKIPDDETVKIRRKAEADKKTDLDAGIELSRMLLAHQATICAYEQLEPDTQNKKGYLQEIARHAYTYTQAYGKYTPAREKEEYVDRSHRSDFRYSSTGSHN